MPPENAKLLVRLKPEPGESIIGYLLRLAEANGYESTPLLLRAFKLRKTNARHTYVYGMTNMRLLAESTCVDMAVLEQMTFNPVGVHSSRFIGNYRAFGQIVPSFVIRPNDPKVCPKCLAEEAFCHKAWELAVLTACPEHSCLLLQHCPKCEGKITWNRKAVCQCACGFDWREAEPVSVPDIELRLANRIYQLFGLRQTVPARLPEHLSELNLMDLLNVLFSIIGQRRGRCDAVGKSLSKKLSSADLHREFNSTIEVFENFPVNFFAFLDSLKDVYKQQLRRNHNANHLTAKRTVIYGGVIRAVFGFKGTQFDFLRDAFNEYYAHEKLKDFGISLDRNKLHANEFQNTHVSLSQARKLLGTTAVVVKAIISAGGVRAVPGKFTDGKEIWFINKQDLAAAKKRLEDCISSVEIQRMLGVQAYHVDYLIQQGLLTEIKDLRITPVFSRVFSRREAEGVNRIFEDALERRSKVFAGTTISATKTAFLLGRLGVDFGLMVCLIRDGLIAPAGKAKGQGLLNFLYDKDEIETFCEAKLTGLKAGTLSVIEAARELKVDRELIKSLIKNQLLHSIGRENAFFLKVRISLESVEAFKNNYVLSNTLAAEIRTMPKNINQTLTESGIMPVDSSSETHCFVYRRSDVEDIRIKKKDNRVTTPLLSTTEVAKILNLEESDVLKLVRNGILMPYHRTENRLKNNPFFTETGIENFKKLGLKNLNVVSRSAAAEIVGIGMTAFKARYIKTKKLIPIELEGRNRRLLYSIDEVEKLRLMELQGVRSTEAAEILNVTISCVNKLTIAGQLKPISGPNVDGFQYNVYIRSEVEALRNERNAFKVGQMKAGKSSRFGRVSGNRYSKTKSVNYLTTGGE